MANLLKRTGKTIFGLFLFSFGYYLSIQANIGLAPWSALSMGLSYVTGLSFGTVSVMTSIVILIIDVFLKEKIGIAMILDAVLVGVFIDLLTLSGIVPMLDNFWLGVAILLIGQVFVSVGSYFYIKPAMGCGPRDSLMIALGKRMPKVPIGAVRGLLEGSALLVGWLLGAKVGLGTVIAVFGIGIILEYTFRLFKFDVKAVLHEDILTSFKNAFATKQ